MKATMLDDRRRLVMPPELPAHSAVTIQQLDEVTWIVKRQAKEHRYKSVVIPLVGKLPDDPEWDKIEAGLAKSAVRNLPIPK